MNIIQKAKNVAQAAQTWVLAGMPIVSKEIHEERVKLCTGCYYFDKMAYKCTGGCNKCGCSVQAKAWLATERCPVGAWDVAEEDTSN